MSTISSKQKADIIITSLRFLSELDLANVQNAIQNEIQKRERDSDDGRGNKSSTEKL